MRISDRRQIRDRSRRIEGAAEAVYQRETAERNKLKRKIEMAQIRVDTVKSLRSLIQEIEEKSVADRIQMATTPILTSSRNPYGMLIAFEFKLKELGVDTTRWEKHLNVLKQKASELTDPKKYENFD